MSIMRSSNDLEGILGQLPAAADSTVFAGWQLDEKRKQAILTMLSAKNPGRHYRFRPVVATIVIFLTVGALTLSIPIARAALKQGFAEAVHWIATTTRIPVYLPQTWLQDTKPTINYYFEAASTTESYSINVYTIDEPVSVNQADQRQIPLSESQYVGSISGHLRKELDPVPPWSLFQLKEAVQFQVKEGVAGKNLGEVEVVWDEGNWRYWVIGHKAPEYARKLIADINTANPLPEADEGWVKIIIGNHVTTYVTWNVGDYQYEFSCRGNDLAQAVEIARDATRWIKENDITGVKPK